MEDCSSFALFSYHTLRFYLIYCSPIRAGNYLIHWPLQLVETITHTFDCFTTSQLFITEWELKMMVGVLPKRLVPCIMPNVACVLLGALLLAESLFHSLAFYHQLLSASTQIFVVWQKHTQQSSSVEDVGMWVDNECLVYIVPLQVLVCTCAYMCVVAEGDVWADGSSSSWLHEYCFVD